MFKFSGRTSRQRGRDKIDGVINWLRCFDYSDIYLLSRYLNVDANGQRHFYTKLEQEGVITSLKLPLIRRRLYCLDRLGRERAQTLYPTEPLKKVSTQPNWTKLAHLFAIQTAVLNRLDRLDDFVAEKFLVNQFKTKHIPDALLVAEQQRTALEVELSHKADLRIYFIFLNHVKNLGNAEYDRVHYVFQDHSLMTLYQTKFDCQEWPVIKYDRSKRKLVKQEITYKPPVELQDAFAFTQETLYDL